MFNHVQTMFNLFEAAGTNYGQIWQFRAEYGHFGAPQGPQEGLNKEKSGHKYSNMLNGPTDTTKNAWVMKIKRCPNTSTYNIFI